MNRVLMTHNGLVATELVAPAVIAAIIWVARCSSSAITNREMSLIFSKTGNREEIASRQEKG